MSLSRKFNPRVMILISQNIEIELAIVKKDYHDCLSFILHFKKIYDEGVKPKR